MRNIVITKKTFFYVFIYFKKTFDWVWYEALCSTLSLYNINLNLINIIKNLYNKATSTVYLNNRGKLFRTTVGVRQGCLLSPTLFNIYLERILAEALENHKGLVFVSGLNITNLRFVDDIDGLARAEDEFRNLVKFWTRKVGQQVWRS